MFGHGSSGARIAIANTIIGAFVLALAVTLGVWASDSANPITDYRADVVTGQVQQGQPLKVRHHFVRQRECHVHLEQITFDAEGVRTVHPDEDFVVSPGGLGEDTFSTAVQIPLSAAPGQGRYRAVRSYYCNPLQSILDWPIAVISPDLRYTIVPRDGAAPVPIDVVPVSP